MTCERYRDLDVAALVADPEASAWEEFRAHAPTCAECARELAGFVEVREDLRVGAHPDPAELLQFSEGGGLAASRRTALEEHLAGCAPCRSELRVLADFDFAAVAAPARAPVSAQDESGGFWDAVREGFAAFLRPPALAMAALVALALVWQVFLRSDTEAPPPIAEDAPPVEIVPEAPAPIPAPEVETQVAETPSVPEPADPTPAPERAPRPDASRLAERAPAPEAARERMAPADPVPDTRIAEQRPSPTLPPVPDPAPTSGPSAEELLAELSLPATPPRYTVQLALAGGSLEPVVTDTVLRAGDDDLPTLRTLGPRHVAATASPQPTLYWHLSRLSPVTVELSLIEEDGIEPLVERRVAAPVAAGLHRFDLATAGVRLTPGRTYLWFATLVRDEDNRDLDVVAGGALRYTAPTAGLSAKLDRAGVGGRAHAFAEAGYWVDAFDALERLSPEDAETAARRAAHRAALLEQAGQGAVAGALTP